MKTNERKFHCHGTLQCSTSEETHKETHGSGQASSEWTILVSNASSWKQLTLQINVAYIQSCKKCRAFDWNANLAFTPVKKRDFIDNNK